MSLEWTQVECFQALTPDGRCYSIVKNWQSGKPYVALLCFTDKFGRWYEHVVGRFDTITEAKSVCENDAKEV